MTLKACLVCGEPTEGSRCDDHRRPHRPKPSTKHGYDTAWRKLSERARRLQPFCTDCGATENLEADHSPEAWKRKAEGKVIRLADIAVVCGPCNIRRGPARGGEPRDRLPDPLGKALSENEIA